MTDHPERVRRRLFLAVAAVAVALVAVTSGTAALAGNPVTKPSASDAAATTAPVRGESDPFVAAVQALVGDGTINQAQADVLRQQIDAGSIDEQQLIDSGVVTAAQMQAVQARLSAVKQSLAAGAASQVPSREKAQPTDSSADSDGAKRAEKEAAAAAEAATHGKAQPTGSPAIK
jgi:hypothetical protein